MKFKYKLCSVSIKSDMSDMKIKSGASLNPLSIVLSFAFVIGIGFGGGAYAEAVVDEIEDDSDLIINKLQSLKVGINGNIKPGEFTSLRVSLDHKYLTQRKVKIQWEVRDSDNELVANEREIMLLPTKPRVTDIELYAPIRMEKVGSEDKAWTIKVVDAESGEVLKAREVKIIGAYQDVVLNRIPASDGVIGFTSVSTLGLDPIGRSSLGRSNVSGNVNWTQHEQISFIRSINPQNLPDRWYGMSMLDTLIWAPRSGDRSITDPTSPNINHQSLIHWVKQGNHLLIVLPAGAQQSWKNNRSFGALFEPIERFEDLGEVEIEEWLTDGVIVDRGVSTHSFVIKPEDKSKVSVIHKQLGTGKPLVIGYLLGAGRVTLIGPDISVNALRGKGGRSVVSMTSFWNPIFGTHSEGKSARFYEKDNKDNLSFSPKYKYVDAGDIEERAVSDFVSEGLHINSTVTYLLLFMFVIFIGYWLVAGPVSWVLLKRKDKRNLSWGIFVLVVLVFGLVSWIGGVFVRPTDESITHVSVLDYIADTGEVKVRSYISMFSPKRGVLSIHVAPNDPASSHNGGNLIAASGADGGGSSGFDNFSTYTVNALSPTLSDVRGEEVTPLMIPWRATAKTMWTDFFGKLDANRDNALLGSWEFPESKVVGVKRGANAGEDQLRGVLSHGLEGDFRNVQVVYCSGGGSVPRIWTVDSKWRWDAGFGLNLTKLTNKSGMLLSVPANTRLKNRKTTKSHDVYLRDWWSGHLGNILAKPNRRSVEMHTVELGDYKRVMRPMKVTSGMPFSADGRAIGNLQLLSFMRNLPPKHFEKRISSNFGGSSRFNYGRMMGRELDLSRYLQLPCVIVMGVLEKSHLPVPMHVDEKVMPSNGLTIVRCVYPISEIK